MSNYFEFSVKADEWLDVTSREEILQNELNRAKNELETRSMEILESNVTIDLLKGHKTLLENERESLQNEVKRVKETLSDTMRELENVKDSKGNLEKSFAAFKASSEANIMALENALASNQKQLEVTKTQINKLTEKNLALEALNHEEKMKAEKKIQSLAETIGKLNFKNSTLEADAKKQAEQIAKIQMELQQSRKREELCRQDLMQQKRCTEQRANELMELKSKMGSVAILAEGLKEKNHTLLRSHHSLQEHLKETKEKNMASLQREAVLKDQIEKERAEYQARMKKQEEVLADKCDKLEQAEIRIVELEACVVDLKEQLVALSSERESLVCAASVMEDKVRELSEEKETLEKELQEQAEEVAADLLKAKDALAREEALKKELNRQKAAFDSRLKEIRTILGVSAIAEIKTEIDAVARLCAENPHLRRCPSIKAPNLRVPLLIGFHHKST